MFGIVLESVRKSSRTNTLFITIIAKKESKEKNSIINLYPTKNCQIKGEYAIICESNKKDQKRMFREIKSYYIKLHGLVKWSEASFLLERNLISEYQELMERKRVIEEEFHTIPNIESSFQVLEFDEANIQKIDSNIKYD